MKNPELAREVRHPIFSKLLEYRQAKANGDLVKFFKSQKTQGNER